MNDSVHFDRVLLETLISHWDEEQRVDFKGQIYNLDSDEAKLKFARHMIAFANVARRIGEPCWMVFGVDDDTRELKSVFDDYPSKGKPKFWNIPNLDVRTKQKDGVEKAFYNFARDWIYPLPRFHLEYGELNGVFLSYLEIEPYYTSVPFCLRRVPDKNSTYTVRTVFMRYGSSSLPVEPSEVQYLVTKSHAAYLTATDWANLLAHHKADDFLEARTLEPSFRHKVAGSGEDALDLVMRLLDEDKRRFLITAEAGHGKTVLLQRIAYTLADRQPEQFENKYYARPFEEQPMEHIPDVRKLEVVPPLPVPIFMDLRMYFADISEFRARLLQRVCEMAQQDDIPSLDALWCIPGSRWVILLDGIDELRNSERAGEALRTWAESLPPNVQIILTARPYAAFEWQGAENISLAQLSDDETKQLLRAHLQTRIDEPSERAVIEERVVEKVEQESDLVALLRCPRAMNGFLRGVLDVYAPVKSQIDRDRVQIQSEARVFSNLPEAQGPLPFASVEPNQGQEESNDFEPQENQEPEENPFVFTMPSLAISVQQIIEYMVGEELKRQKGFGNTKAEIGAAKAQEELRRVAWQTDWDSESFDRVECKEKRWLAERSLIWNQNIGFVRTSNCETYFFYCALLKHYKAAARAFRLDDKRVKEEFNKTHRKDSQGRVKILELLNELRTENGKDKIQIP